MKQKIGLLGVRELVFVFFWFCSLFGINTCPFVHLFQYIHDQMHVCTLFFSSSFATFDIHSLTYSTIWRSAVSLFGVKLAVPILVYNTKQLHVRLCYLPSIWQSITYTLKVDSKDPSRKNRRQQLSTADFSANLLVHLYLFYFGSVNGAILQISRLHQKRLHIKIYLLLLYLNWSKVKHYAHFFSDWIKRNWNLKTCKID